MTWEYLEAEVEALRGAGLLRVVACKGDPGVGPGSQGVDVCSNDYLGYARSGVSRETILEASRHAAGSGGSRLISGTHPVHLALEEALADWVGLPSALLSSSGYAANVGCIAALAGEGDVVLSDALNHASLIDGCRLSRAAVVVYPHLDATALAKELARLPRTGRTWVLTESYFSMDGDTPDLPALRRLCDEAGARLIVDEAHALGVFGSDGAGLCSRAGIAPDVLVGTLGKAIGTQGAFVAGATVLRTWLWNRARSFVFSTAPSPLLSALTLDRLTAVRRDDEARSRLAENAATLREDLRRRGVPVVPGSHGPIVPVILGENPRATAAASALAAHGYRALAIRPPTVPEGTSRLRVTLSANLSAGQLRELGALLQRACEQ